MGSGGLRWRGGSVEMAGSERLVVVPRAVLEGRLVHAILLDHCDGEW